MSSNLIPRTKKESETPREVILEESLRLCIYLDTYCAMNVYPNAKLNLGLFVTGRRPDGYHLLETAFLPVPLCDELELELTDTAEDELIVTGGVETGELQDNLVLRAVWALRRVHSFPSLRLRLTKQIPSGAGMGGGSSDASFTLTAINELCALGCSQQELEAIALTLGGRLPHLRAQCACCREGHRRRAYPDCTGQAPRLSPHHRQATYTYLHGRGLPWAPSP